MYIAAHTVVIARNAGHVLFHAVCLRWAVFVAAILKTDNKSSSLYTCRSPSHKHTHTVLSQQKKGPFFILAWQWTERQSGCREARSHMETVRHTALLVKALNAGQAMPGVICWKQTKKNSALLFNCNYQEKLLNTVGNTLGGELALLWAAFIWASEPWLTQDALPAALLAGHAVVVIWILHLPWEK